MDGSKAWGFNGDDLYHVFVRTFFAGVAAMLAYFLAEYSPHFLPGNAYQATLMTFLVAILSAAQRWIQDTQIR
jgi:hypothetical protein